MDSVQSDRELTLESIRGRRVGLTPASVEDLEPLSHLFDALKAQGADVVAISPQQHDRRLAELAFLPRLVMMPMIRYWSENTDVSESGGFLPSLRMLENLGEASRQQTADWAEEVFHNKGHVLLALDGYAQHLNTLRQELSNDKFGEFAAHCARQLAELKTSFSAEATSAADTEIGEPTVNSVLAMLENVWQTIGQIEQTTDNEMAMTELSEVRKLLNQTTSHLRQLSLTVANPPVVADVMASASAAVAAPRVYAPISPSAPMASGSEPISAEEAYSGAVVEDESSEYDSTVDAPRLEFSPVVAEAQPAPPPALAFDSSGGRDLWLQCGSDVQAFATAARVLADARIGVENVERQQNAAGMLVRITLREVEQALRARDLLSQAGIAVSSAAGH
jgi:hypothetical protein